MAARAWSLMRQRECWMTSGHGYRYLSNCISISNFCDRKDENDKGITKGLLVGR